MPRLARRDILPPDLLLLTGFEDAGHPVGLEHRRIAAFPGLQIEDPLERGKGDRQVFHLALVGRHQRQGHAVTGWPELAVAVSTQYLVVDEMDRHPLIAGDIYRVGGRPRIEQDVFEAAEWYEGPAIVRPQVEHA